MKFFAPNSSVLSNYPSWINKRCKKWKTAFAVARKIFMRGKSINFRVDAMMDFSWSAGELAIVGGVSRSEFNFPIRVELGEISFFGFSK